MKHESGRSHDVFKGGNELSAERRNMMNEDERGKRVEKQP